MKSPTIAAIVGYLVTWLTSLGIALSSEVTIGDWFSTNAVALIIAALAIFGVNYFAPSQKQQ